MKNDWHTKREEIKMKTVKVLATAMLSLALVAGCSSPNNNGNSATETPKQTASNEQGGKETEKKEDVTIKYYSWEDGTAEENTMKKIANFEKANPNVKVEYVKLVTNASSTDFYQKLDIMAGTGDAIDVVAFSHVDFLIERAARGILAPIDEYLGADGIKPENEFFINPIYDGKVYGIQDLAQPWLVAINKQALDAAGLEAPTWGWTWDDFSEYAQKMTKDAQYGTYFHTWGEYANFPAYNELPHPYLKEDETPVFDEKVFADFFDMRRALEDSKSVKPFSDVVASKLHYASEYLNGEAAMVPAGSFLVGMIKDKEKYPHDFQTVFAPLPRSSESVEIGSSYVGGHYNAIGANSKHKKESYDFIKFLAQQTDVITDFPGSKSVDAELVISSMADGFEDLIDVESLKNTVYDSRVHIPYDPTFSTAYSSQLKKVLEDGLSMFLLDKTSAADAQAWMVEEANKIIKQSK